MAIHGSYFIVQMDETLKLLGIKFMFLYSYYLKNALCCYDTKIHLLHVYTIVNLLVNCLVVYPAIQFLYYSL